MIIKSKCNMTHISDFILDVLEFNKKMSVKGDLLIKLIINCNDSIEGKVSVLISRQTNLQNHYCYTIDIPLTF